jgi:LysR family transcriptional regulator, glycine cleavage system transcriptional activator
MQRIPPIHSLKSFATLARLRSVTRTSEELYVTPSAICHRIRQLEEISGARLFVRTDFSLTNEGAIYLERVSEALNALNRLSVKDE